MFSVDTFPLSSYKHDPDSIQGNMMFAYENEMCPIAERWLAAQKLVVRREFYTNSGDKIDLVGARLNPESVTRRMAQRQQLPLCHASATAMMLAIPDHDFVQPEYVQRLFRLEDDRFEMLLNRLIRQRFVQRNEHGELLRINGWLPLHERFVAIELKLAKIKEVLDQSRANLAHFDESYAALPDQAAMRVFEKRARWADYFDAGVGLLAINRRRCKVLIPAIVEHCHLDEVSQFIALERFWKTRVKDSLALKARR